VVAVEEKWPQKKKNEPREGTKPSAARGGRKGGTPVGYSGRTALRREQCDEFGQSIARQELNKHVPTHASRNNTVEVISTVRARQQPAGQWTGYVAITWETQQTRDKYARIWSIVYSEFSCR
jgi:hypothetical protein